MRKAAIFDDLPDAEDFAEAVRGRGEAAELSEELLYDHRDAKKLIATERAP